MTEYGFDIVDAPLIPEQSPPGPLSVWTFRIASVVFAVPIFISYMLVFVQFVTGGIMSFVFFSAFLEGNGRMGALYGLGFIVGTSIPGILWMYFTTRLEKDDGVVIAYTIGSAILQMLIVMVIISG